MLFSRSNKSACADPQMRLLSNCRSFKTGYCKQSDDISKVTFGSAIPLPCKAAKTVRLHGSQTVTLEHNTAIRTP